MSKTVRIRTTPDGSDKYLKLKIEQDFDFLEVLSLKISQEDVYRKYNSDYGVVVGRVVINNGFGVKNAKVSLFIPIDEIDKQNSEIKDLYPYETVYSKDLDGIRYNLLTKEPEGENNCFTPVGTFPSKREVLDNEIISDIYEKYYKFTTTTNFAGDFMLFGVPLGQHVIHVDADISDIGIASQRPYDLIEKGAPIGNFENPTKFLGGTNLDKLIQVKTLNSGVNILPFWGDVENKEIGITRLDLDLQYDITPSAIFLGSTFGDSDKNSVNKRCRPRKKLGELSLQTTGKGTIYMIRKRLDGKIEEFNVDGGDLIDDDGTWSYQIPMNLDYMVTAEDGSLTLSEDPNKGIPTRASVRFDIGMSNTGGEGRIRTRARHLVPNNPTKPSEIDYEFGQKTKDTSFRELQWNKIYTVGNYISRFHRTNGLTGTLTRNATGVKNVEDSGTRAPFPYNRVNTETNPIFIIICIIMTILNLILWFLNAIIFEIINIIINAWNSLMRPLCKASGKRILGVKIFGFLGFTCKLIINNIPCIVINCPGEDGETFSPGCGGITIRKMPDPKPTYKGGLNVGLIECVAFTLAEALDMFQFDFYNDWVNGTLFSFLLKYKKRRKGREKFCEVNCDDIGGGGVDGDKNGSPDNNCKTSSLSDTGFGSGKDTHKNTKALTLREGLIKKVGNRFYYGATDKTANKKLFATEIINLGSIFDCDWQGIPKIQQYLVPSTFKIPPSVEELSDDKKTVDVSGMVKITKKSCGTFFSVDCIGLHVDKTQSINIKRMCEYGVDLDQAIEEEGIIADCVIGKDEIDDGKTNFVRDVIYDLNHSTTPWYTPSTSNIPPTGYSTYFNSGNTGNYEWMLVNTPGFPQNNGPDYIKFRGYHLGAISATTSDMFAQTKHSYYFYFGLYDGKTSLDKMNRKFFANCVKPVKQGFIIETDTTNTTGTASNGTITYSFLGGIQPYSATTFLLDSTGVPTGTGIQTVTTGDTIPTTLSNLAQGNYLISVVDSTGNIVTTTVTVEGPTPLFCATYVLSNISSAGASDGEITIAAAGGGIGPLSYTLTNSLGAIIGSANTPINTSLLPITIGALPKDEIIGYTMIIKDSSTPVTACTTTGLTITGAETFQVVITSGNPKCFDSYDGFINFNITGGKTPYTITTTGPDDFTSFITQNTELDSGTYTVTVLDNSEPQLQYTQPITLTSPPEIIVSEGLPSDLQKQCDPNIYYVPFYLISGVSGAVKVEYNLLDGETGPWIPYVFPTAIQAPPLNNLIPMLIRLEFNQNITQQIILNDIHIRVVSDNGQCYSEVITYNKSEMSLPTSVLTTSTIPTTQCSPTTATFRFNISHLLVGNTSRSPYTIEYKVGTNPTILTAPLHYSGPVTITVASQPGSTFNIHYRVKDNKGCQYPTNGQFVTELITVPTSAISGSIGPGTNNGGGTYSRQVISSGGIGQRTLYSTSITGGSVQLTSSPQTVINNSLVMVGTIRDTQGCSTDILAG